MFEVLVAKHAGACFGVERALRLVHETAEKTEGPIYTLGPLIHNPIVVADLEKADVHVAASVGEAPVDSTLILRTHGVAPSVVSEALEADLEVIDATCPFVTRCHEAAKSLSEAGYQVVVVGEKGHPETEATSAEVEGSLILGSRNDVREATLANKVGLVCQTTISEETLAEVAGAIVCRARETKVINTICAATRERQEAARQVAERADVMIVLGGKASANTCHLFDIASSVCERTYHIEEASELDPAWFTGARLVGLTAGASTPKDHIDACVQALEEIAQGACQGTPH